MKKVSGILLALLTFFSSTLNVFADAVEVYEEKTQTINKEDYESLKQEVEQKVYNLNESDDEYVYDYEITITKEEDEVVVTDTKKVTSEKKFTSEAEAKKFYEEYQLEDSWKQGELTITSSEESVVVKGDTITVTCSEASCADKIAEIEATLNEYEDLEVISKETTSKDDQKTIVYEVGGKAAELTYEDAVKLVLTLNPQVDGYKLVKNEYVLVKKGSVDAKTFKELVGKDTYETYQEAKEASDKFLKDERYEEKVAVIVAIYDDSEKETNKTTLPGQLTEELAYTIALADAKAELEKAIEEGRITIEGTIEEAKKALENAYKTGKLQLNGIELDGRVVYYSLPEKRTVRDVKELSQTFFTKTGAELAKSALEATQEGLKEQGVTIEDITITETNENATNISAGVPVPGYKGKYTITPTSIGYYSLEKGNSIVIWTPSALTAEQKEQISTSVKENNDKIKRISFVTGYNEEQHIEGIGKFTFKETARSIFGQTIYSYSLELNGEGTTVKTGTLTNSKVYKLSYKLVTTTELWYVDKTEIKYGFDYTVQGGGVKVTRDLFNVQSILAGKIYNHTMAYRVNNTQSYTSYVASFDIYKEETITNATVSYKITREKAATGNVGPGGSGEGITPPNTGAESNLFISLSLLALLAGVISLKKLCK
ncbi:MAG: hypothetical protein E7171_06240 [Firmicutes bacterium]|nr:hypothetical protein [Bacillota bacterium]